MLIFDEATLRKLEQLTLAAEQVRVGVLKGERRSRKRGDSIEFADYRNYAQGDDLRRLDWNVYARLERPFIKLLEAEEDLAVHLLVDGSGSMDWPREGDEGHKFHYALRLAGALGHVALTTGDQVTATILSSRGDGGIRGLTSDSFPNPLIPASLVWGPHRGRANSLRLLQFLDGWTAAGVIDLNLALRHYALRARRPGLLFLLSDLLAPAGFREGVGALQGRGYEVILLHLLSPDEVQPNLSGDLKLVDVETGADAEISLDGAVLGLYRKRLQAWQEEIAVYCRGRQIHYVPVTTNFPWDKLVLQTLRAQGVIQ
ncbi:MAG: DUF58 domain-containing protein [Chloroflexota bacterium]